MNRSPAFQFYPKQWLGDDRVLLMDWDARGMHVHLQCIAWQQDPPCSLPNDDTALRKWCGNPKRWRKVKDQILSAWKLIGGRWVQEGLLREYEKQRQYSESRRHAAEARWGRGDAYALRTQSVRNALPLQSSTSEEKIAVPTSSGPANSTQGNGGKARRLNLTDDAFLAALKQNHAYRGIDIDRELGKLQAWLLTPKGRGKHLTQNRLVNWLNKIDRPMQSGKERLPL